MDKYVDFIARMITEDPNILREASKKKKPSKGKRPKIDIDEFDDKFSVNNALEDLDGPAKPSKKSKRKSGLDKNTGAKQTGSAYLK